LQTECTLYIKSDNVPKSIKTSCKKYNVRVADIFKFGHSLDKGVENDNANEKSLNKYLKLLQQAEEDRVVIKDLIRSEFSKARSHTDIDTYKELANSRYIILKDIDFQFMKKNEDEFIKFSAYKNHLEELEYEKRKIERQQKTTQKTKKSKLIVSQGKVLCHWNSLIATQKFSKNEYAIKFKSGEKALLTTDHTTLSNKYGLMLWISSDSHTETVTYTSGFKDTVRKYRECTKAEQSITENRGKQKIKEIQQKRKNKQSMGCTTLYKNKNIGTLEGTVNIVLDDGFRMGNYFINTTNTSVDIKNYLKNNNYGNYKFIKVVVQRTNKYKSFSLLELYPYNLKEGESEYSRNAINFRRRYPANKNRALEELMFVDFYDARCK